MLRLRKKSKRVTVFGVFDGLHEGHRAFLRQAKRRGGELIAVVAPDAAVRELKKKEPRLSEKERVLALRRSRLADRVILGDKKQGTYRVVQQYNPELICLGYDQFQLGRDLKRRMEKGSLLRVRLVRLKRLKE